MNQLLDLTKTVSEIVQEDYRAADVFKKHGINYCCSGRIALLEACSARNIEYSTVIEDLRQATKVLQISNALRFSEWRIDFLVDYIINVHHAYVDVAMPEIETSLELFMDGHRKKHPELEKVLDLFKELAALMDTHKRHEEEIIFPYIKQIDNTHRRKETYGNLFVRTLRKPLSNIAKEHDMISSILKEIQVATNNYTFPPNACTNHRVIFQRLREFHDDMMQHKHLENNILFPRAIDIEKELLQL
jgi:regulator of cell morphogenesis and NO signaling